MNAVVQVAPGSLQALHRHDESRLVLFVSGEMQEETFGGNAQFAAGEFVFRPAYFAHADVTGDCGAAFVRLPVSTRAARRWVARNGWRAARGRATLDRDLHGDDLLESACASAYSPAASSTLMQQAARLLMDDGAPCVRDVAQRLGLAPYQLTRLFAAEYGLTPIAYRQQARLQRAIGLLSEDAASLAEIALVAGYHDQSHLTLDLRRQIGLTPGALRTVSQ